MTIDIHGRKWKLRWRTKGLERMVPAWCDWDVYAIYLNPNLTRGELGGVLIHEILHAALHSLPCPWSLKCPEGEEDWVEKTENAIIRGLSLIPRLEAKLRAETRCPTCESRDGSPPPSTSPPGTPERRPARH